MPGGLRDEIELDISSALGEVRTLEASLDAAAKSFRVELARSLDVLRVADTHVDITADARQVTGAITGAVDAANTGVVVTGEARDVTGAITGAVDAADTTVDVDVDPKAFRQLRADIDKVNAELNDTRAQLDKVEGELEQVRRKGRDVETSFGGIRKAAGAALSALGTRFVIDQVQEMIGAASDLNESVSKSTVVFGESQGVIDEWAANSATAVGLAKQEALEAAGTFGNLFTALGLAQGAAADLAPDVVQLGADLASFNNLGVPDTLEKLRSGLVGEIEPLRSLGISFTAVNVEAKAAELGLRDANGEISEGAKVQARWALITEQSTAAAGDFARTSDGLANQQRILTAELGDARAEIGARLLPVMLDLINKGRGLLDFFLDLPEPVQNVALGLIAVGIAAGPVVLAVGNITKVVTGVTGAVRGLSTLLGTSSLVIGTWAAALIAIGAVFLAYNKYVQGTRQYHEDLNNVVAESVNAEALAAESWRSGNEALKARAVAAFIATGGMDRTTKSENEVALATNLTTEALKAIEEQTPKAAAVLASLSESSGLTKERIVQLANAMGINLATATDKQREKLGSAIASITQAVNPTDRLKVAAETLGNQFATSKEQIDAFADALDAALGVYLSSEEATIRVRQQVDELTKAFTDGRQKGESLRQFQDRMTLSTIDLTRKVEAEVDALVKDGTVSADAASQKKALIDRLLFLASTLGGPMAEELRQHAYRIAQVPDEKVTAIGVDTKPATNALKGAEAEAKAAGERVAEGFGSGITSIIDKIRWRIAEAGAKAGGALEEGANARLHIRSPSRVGMEIGGFFVEGIVLGVDAAHQVATQAAEALAAGVGDVMLDAARITAEESRSILEAVASISDAEVALSEARRDHGAASIEARIAELDLADAQAEVNRRTLDAIDATDAITAALERQRAARDRLNQSLDNTLGSLDAVTGVQSARRALDQAERELAAAQARAASLPGEVAAATRALAAARTEAERVTAAEQLAIVRAQKQVADAQARVTAASSPASVSNEEALAIVRAKQQVATAEKRLTDEQAKATPDALAIEEATLLLVAARDDLAKVTAAATAQAGDLREAQLDLVVAQENLTRVQKEATAPTQAVELAERALKDLLKEQAEVAERVRAATDGVTEAQLRLVGAQRALIAAGEELQATGPGWEGIFRTIATAAGLSRTEVDALVASIEAAARLAQNANTAQFGAGGRLVNTVTGRPAFTGPNGEGGSAGPRGVPGETSWIMPDGTRAWYVPRQHIDAGNLGALGRVAPSLPPVVPNLPATTNGRQSFTTAGTVRTQNVTINPKKAVYDPKATVATLRVLELLGK